jgi:hypothetical protein
MNPQAGICFYAEGSALKRGAAVTAGTARDQVKLAGSANSLIVGYVINDADEDQEVAVFPANGAGKCKAIAGTTFNAGVYLELEGTDGKVKEITSDNTLRYACGIALEAATAEDQLVDILPVAFVAFTALT